MKRIVLVCATILIVALVVLIDFDYGIDKTMRDVDAGWPAFVYEMSGIDINAGGEELERQVSHAILSGQGKMMERAVVAGSAADDRP